MFHLFTKWIDGRPTDNGRKFDVWRTGRLFVAIMVSYMGGGVLVGIPWLFVAEHQRSIERSIERQKKAEQEQKEWEDTQKAIRDGTAGEAIRRLYGVEPPVPPAKTSDSRKSN